MTGRPYALGTEFDAAAAVVQAFFLGQRGGQALAEVLTGAVNPSGRLPVSVPRDAGGLPGTYLAPPLGHLTQVSSIDPTPAYPFGHGLSYTTFRLVRRLGRRAGRRGVRRSHRPGHLAGRRRGAGTCHSPQHRLPIRHRGRAALPARPGGADHPTGDTARRVRPGAVGARRGCRRDVRRPADVTSFTGRSGGASSSPATSSCGSAGPAATNAWPLRSRARCGRRHARSATTELLASVPDRGTPA